MANDNWKTPPEVFETLNNEFCFLADVACSFENKLCPVGFTEENDSLAEPWLERLKHSYPYIGNNAYVFCNPPYSKPMPWIKQAIQAQKDGLGTVMILNADTSVSWFTEAIKYLSEIRFVIGDKKEGGGYSIGRLPTQGDRTQTNYLNSHFIILQRRCQVLHDIFLNPHEVLRQKPVIYGL